MGFVDENAAKTVTHDKIEYTPRRESVKYM